VLVWERNASKDLALPSGEKLIMCDFKIFCTFCFYHIFINNSILFDVHFHFFFSLRRGFVGCTDMATAVGDLISLTDEIHRVELGEDRAALFMKQALISLIHRRDAIHCFTPPRSVLMRGSMFYRPPGGGGSGTGASHDLEAAASVGGGVGEMNGSSALAAEGGAMGSMSAGGGSSSVPASLPAPALDGAAWAGVAAARVGGCLRSVGRYLGSNPYASIDVLNDLEEPASIVTADRCAALQVEHHHSRLQSSSSTPGVPAVPSSAATASNAAECSLSQCNVAARMLLSNSTVPFTSHHPYVGNLISVHCGHNGWPTTAEIAALVEFFAKNGAV
jgi:hypothetical protein